jgi:5'-nucleotidase / UDP-sugar diphosphatase
MAFALHNVEPEDIRLPQCRTKPHSPSATQVFHSRPNPPQSLSCSQYLQYLQKQNMIRHTMKRNWKPFSIFLPLTIAFFSLPVRAEKVDITLLQINDVYEITPISNGKVGGLARVATLRKELLQQNPNLMTVLPGDFLSPSALGTAKVNGESLAGQQMVATLNTMGLNLATFGNHEFDIKEPQLLKRLQESKFGWISSNVTDAQNQPFPGVKRSKIVTFKGKQGATVRVGFIGVTIDSNPASYVKYSDPYASARQEIAALKPNVDIIVALTHLSISQDQKLAETVPEVDIILGGHEHENIQQLRGADFTPIYKADANAKTVYIHRLQYDTEARRLAIDSQLKPITDELPSDPQTAAVVDTWVNRGYDSFRQNGFQPEAIVATVPYALDGAEGSVRNKPTQLTQLIAESMRTTSGADLAMFNGGSIRVDDVLPPGPITQYDIIRILPFGGIVQLVELPGSTLLQALNQGIANQGTGGYLQTSGIEFNATTKTWMIQGKPLQLTARYRIAINDFLMSGKEKGLAFLNFNTPDIRLLSEHGDVRFALIKQLQTLSARSAR